ncbi:MULTISPECIES: ComF family protein [Jonquetella]|uniref:Putative amidophosphoribosyltransferase n=1 Tax=Jonquetella anthropi DSM 22815 TaxID=885272 RepID=H0UL67_9BACT|nr:MULTISPECIES: double zinc ribbon domain-containing protein [Jonquetella]EHM13426.1 putative amidophosphoribosyltransferase [Jonquetella anthropi DSM 22815]ERL24311.1 phosphoribosyl transferase domain protein [Jonquetella sp. BV3C21]
MDLAGALCHLLWPQQCVSCGAPGEALCSDCEAMLPPRLSPVCLVCGAPAPCKTHGVKYVLHSRTPHEGTARELVLKSKYGRWGELAYRLGQLAAEGVELSPGNWSVAAVPPRRYFWKTSFPHTLWLRRGAAAQLKLPQSSPLRWNARTERQTEKKTRTARLAMNPKSFAAADCEAKDFILIDDVTTTGTTLRLAAKTLYAAGARRVACLSWSRALSD